MNGNSGMSCGNSFLTEEQQVASLPWMFRVHVPGWQARS